MLKYIALFLFLSISLQAQVENIHVSHPVYEFLKRAETKGLIKHYSTSSLPWSKGKITDALNLIENNSAELTKWEKRSFERFRKEFGITQREDAIVIPSSSEDDNVFFDDIFSQKEKFLYYYSDSVTTVKLRPLARVDMKYEDSDPESRNYTIGSLGFRLDGTIDNKLGYNLQVTNGRMISGDRELALEDPYYSKNVKFNILEDDIDFTESHVRYQSDWFYGSIARQYREMGSGLTQKAYITPKSPAFDALTLGAEFKRFKYEFILGSLLGKAKEAPFDAGFLLTIPEKYISMHRFSITPSWGEIAFWEGVVYSRGIDLAYLNPLSFLKSLEHSLKDRDNSLMGLEATYRPFKNLQLKSTFMLDDIIFEQIGSGHFGNKFAFNAAAMYALPFSLEAGFEYSRISPFTYTHYNTKNAYTNDEMMLGSYMPPNSDKFTFLLNWWFGCRYPLELKVSYFQHGQNIYDEEGNLIKNVGGDPLITQTPGDDNFYTFLDGNKIFISKVELEGGIEPFRGFNLRGNVALQSVNSEDPELSFRLIMGIYEF